MTDINSSEDILDVRDIITRFEELEEARTPWAINWNMPGYMPDNEAMTFTTWEDARDALKEELERFSEECADNEKGEQNQAEIAGAISGLETTKDGEEIGFTAGTFHWSIFKVDGEGLDEDDAKEFASLKELLEDLCGAGGDEEWRGDWYPVTLIADSHFTDYARELLEDCGDLPKNLPHYIAIDWEETAKNIRVDYSSCEFEGNSFWYR